MDAPASQSVLLFLHSDMVSNGYYSSGTLTLPPPLDWCYCPPFQ